MEKKKNLNKTNLAVEDPAIIGDEETGKIRVIAFSAGGADNVFSFGMVHALMVSDPPKPHIVSGTSTGAVVAAMVAEVLQAGETTRRDDKRHPNETETDRKNREEDEKDYKDARRLAQVARFRTLLDQIQKLPSDFKEATLPDFTEVSARAGLEPLNLPTQPRKEKEEREETAGARFGLTRLINGLLSSRVNIRQITRLIRLMLEFVALEELYPKLKTHGTIWGLNFRKAKLFFGLWLEAFWPAMCDAPLLGHCAWAVVSVNLNRKLRLRSVKSIMFESPRWWILKTKDISSYLFVLLLWLFAPVLAFGAVIARLCGWDLMSCGAELGARFLDGFGIKRDLLTCGVLHNLLKRAFDPGYYGKRDFGKAINEALNGVPEDPTSDHARRQLKDWIWYSKTGVSTGKIRNTPILVAPVAVDVSNGELVTLECEHSIVDALSAACALTPWFEPKELEATPGLAGGPKRWLIDASCVAREPLRPVLELIKRLHIHHPDINPPPEYTEPFRDLRLAEPKLVELCVISPYPTRRLREQEREQLFADMTSGKQMNLNPNKPKNRWNAPGTLHRLADILALQATHAAKEERTMITLYNAALRTSLETGGALFCASDDTSARRDINKWHVHAALREIEPEKPVQMMMQLARCSGESQRYSMFLSTIADGCRASLKSLFRNKLGELSGGPNIIKQLAEQDAVEQIGLKTKITPPCRALQDALQVDKLPGILDDMSPPGIAEICQECRFFKETYKSWKEIQKARQEAEDRRGKSGITPQPDWGDVETAPQERFDIKKHVSEIKQIGEWPLDRDATKGSPPKSDKERPTVSLIFSGGVFRGVFQVGVINAYNMAGLKPDLVAGASVGTIMAAFAARIFSEPDACDRHRRIASIAATFLAVDRLILTDRFANFIRRFTLRAGAADFSLRDADNLFRTFDRRNWNSLNRGSRRVLAGIHRLAYVDPIKLLEILSLSSPRKRGQMLDGLILHAQEGLDLAGIGTELLGAEPLEELIKEHVMSGNGDESAQFDQFYHSDGIRPGGIHFMATCTNLTTGELDVLGSFGNDERRPALLPGLLASSAFPAVFRPRMNWELRAGSPGEPEELVDGGIADNLPIIPVYRFLFYAGAAEWMALRPKSKDNKARPHLLLTASLEPEKRDLSESELAQTTDRWTKLGTRVSQLRYNVKVDVHRKTQSDLREIFDQLKKQGREPDPENDMILPDLHISCIKPEWLGGTFAFHPMLGFKRQTQAESIAHGCARTLAHLCHEQEAHSDWTESWWKNRLQLVNGTCETRSDGTYTLKPKPAKTEGDCYFIEGHKCPFSKTELLGVNPRLGNETVAALANIYHGCGRITTHQRVKK